MHKYIPVIACCVVVGLAACDSDGKSETPSFDGFETDARDAAPDVDSTTLDTTPRDTRMDGQSDSTADTRAEDTSERDSIESIDADTDGLDMDAESVSNIRVELTWTNPDDPDETDTTGSDVDLQMVKLGPGKWFEEPYALFFRNPNQDGDEIWNPGAPRLTEIDEDGAGPEEIRFPNPQNCEWYGVGVHYYRQRFGTAYATVRIYVDGTLAFEKIDKPLENGGEFWDVARIHARTFDIQSVNQIQPEPPVEEHPTVTDAMKGSGHCTAQDLY